MKQSQQDDAASGKPDEKQRKKQTIPHLINLNEDPMLSRVICHFLEQGSINAINSETNKLAFYRCSRKMSVFNACVRKGSKVPEEAMGRQMQCKPFVTPCHLGKLKLASTSPNVILATDVVPKTF